MAKKDLGKSFKRTTLSISNKGKTMTDETTADQTSTDENTAPAADTTTAAPAADAAISETAAPDTAAPQADAASSEEQAPVADTTAAPAAMNAAAVTDTAAPQVVEQPAAQADVAAAAPIPQPAAPAVTAQAAPTQLTSKYNMADQVQSSLVTYLENMADGKAVDPKQGAKWQHSLFSTIKHVLSSATQETFNKDWNTMLKFFEEHKESCFNEMKVYRFPQHWPGSEKEYAIYRKLVHILMNTSTIETRMANIRAIDVEKAFGELEESVRNKLHAFYNL